MWREGDHCDASRRLSNLVAVPLMHNSAALVQVAPGDSAEDDANAARAYAVAAEQQPARRIAFLQPFSARSRPATRPHTGCFALLARMPAWVTERASVLSAVLLCASCVALSEGLSRGLLQPWHACSTWL